MTDISTNLEAAEAALNEKAGLGSSRFIDSSDLEALIAAARKSQQRLDLLNQIANLGKRGKTPAHKLLLKAIELAVQA